MRFHAVQQKGQGDDGRKLIERCITFDNFSIDVKIYPPILYSCKIHICRRQTDPRRQGIPIEQIFCLFLIEF